MQSLQDQMIDISLKIRQARSHEDLAALAVLEPQMERLLDSLQRTQMRKPVTSAKSPSPTGG